MGFDHNRVRRIFDKLGSDDKKVILFVLIRKMYGTIFISISFCMHFQIVEHLIPLCELLDLGFDETKISDALIRFGNDKDKALDYLIS